METHDPKRRIVLIGSFAAGAALVLEGCKGKQQEAASQPAATPAGAAPQAAPQTGERRVEEATPSKMSQEGAQYQDHPQDGRKCADCANFIAASKTCKVVDGQISPQGWCIFWTKA